MGTLSDITNLDHGAAGPVRHAPWDSMPGAPHSQAAPDDDEGRMMRELAICYDGRYYRCNGFRYDYLAQAVNYARLGQW